MQEHGVDAGGDSVGGSETTPTELENHIQRHAQKGKCVHIFDHIYGVVHRRNGVEVFQAR